MAASLVSVLVNGNASSNRDTELLARVEQLESELVQVKASLMRLRRQQVVVRRKVNELIDKAQVFYQSTSGFSNSSHGNCSPQAMLPLLNPNRCMNEFK